MCLTNTRPDICFVVNNLSQFLMDRRHSHLGAKHAVRYLKGIVEYGLKYDTNQKTNLHGYVDSDWWHHWEEEHLGLLLHFEIQHGLLVW